MTNLLVIISLQAAWICERLQFRTVANWLVIIAFVLLLAGCSTLSMVAQAAYEQSPATAASQPMFVCGSWVDPETGKLFARPCARVGL